MSIPKFFARMELLNSYLPLLPCLKDSNQATNMTARMNMSFPEHELDVIILHCMPKVYDDQYYMTTNFIPTALDPLHVKLETISRAIDDIKQYKHKGEAYTLVHQGRKKHFTPYSNNLPRKNNKSGKKKGCSKKF